MRKEEITTCALLIWLCAVNLSSGTAHLKMLESTIDLNLTFGGDESQANVYSHNKVVVCYVGTWATYRTPEDGKYDLESIDPTLCTHLVYGFAGLDNDTYTLKPLDPWLDISDEKNGGGRDWYTHFNNYKKKYSHLKILLAVGGWNEGSKKFSDMAADEALRAEFIRSSIDLIRKYGFDGLDLDWEFPGSRGGVPEDNKHFTILVQEFRRKCDKYGLLLTAAFSANEKVVESAYELPELSRNLDHFHVMCYDYHGAWDNLTSHNAPLYSPVDEGSVSASVDYFISQGVHASKIVLGVPFYGRTFLLTPPDVSGSGLLQMSDEKGFQGPYTKEDGFLGYNEICKELLTDRGDWKTFWDRNARVPYMRRGAKWVSFDNPDSIQEKVAFAMSRGLKGIMVWSIDTDDFRGACGVKNPLLKTINSVLSETQDEVINEVDTSPPFHAKNENESPTSGSDPSGVIDLFTSTISFLSMLASLF